jgi:hypothetical protein
MMDAFLTMGITPRIPIVKNRALRPPCAPRGRATGLHAAPALFLAAVCFLVSACSQEVNLPRQYAVLYGVSDYVTLNDLAGPKRDIEDMNTLLCGKGYTTYVKTNDGATKSAFEAEIQTVASIAEKVSMFLFYFSGHGGQFPATGPEPGKQDGMDEGIAFYDYDPDDISAGCLTDDGLMRLISRIPSRQKVIIIDACNSGGFIGDSPGVDTGNSSPISSAAEAFGKYFANTASGDIAYTQAIVITAAGEQELSWDSGYYNHGVFTYFLLQTPARADVNRDGYVTASEAYYFTKNAVISVWNSRNPANSFYPHISGGAMDFVLFEAD